MFRTLSLSACAAVLLIGLAPGAASAGGVMLPMSPVGAPELTAPSVNVYANAFLTTKGKGIGDGGHALFSLSSPEFVSISFSGFSISDIRNNSNPMIGGAVLSVCDAVCQADWMGKQPTAVNVQVADYISPGTGTPQGIEPSEQIKYFSSAGWYLPANTGGTEYELCFDGIATKTGANSYSGAVTITGVPEVSTWAMTLLGFAGLGFMGSLVRKRRGADPIAL
jgi:hypothetical protein